MNLFFLDEDEAANEHLRKMPLEAAQMLYTALFILLGKDKVRYAAIVRSAPLTCSTNQRGYNPTHIHHPIVAFTVANPLRVINYGLSLCNEYKSRFEKQHAVQRHLIWLKENMTLITETGSEEVSKKSPLSGVNARNNYRSKAAITFKRPMHYTKRQPPDWLKLEMTEAVFTKSLVPLILLLTVLDFTIYPPLPTKFLFQVVH